MGIVVNKNDLPVKAAEGRAKPAYDQGDVYPFIERRDYDGDIKCFRNWRSI
jgi:hypothetical protein